jgi:hypothetical protein
MVYVFVVPRIIYYINKYRSGVKKLKIYFEKSRAQDSYVPTSVPARLQLYCYTISRASFYYFIHFLDEKTASKTFIIIYT